MSYILVWVLFLVQIRLNWAISKLPNANGYSLCFLNKCCAPKLELLSHSITNTLSLSLSLSLYIYIYLSQSCSQSSDFFPLFHCPCFESFLLFAKRAPFFFHMASQIIVKSSLMQKLESFLGPTSSSKREFLILQTTFRVLTIIFLVIAISVMVTSSQSIVMFGFTFKASYSYSSALKYVLIQV